MIGKADTITIKINDLVGPGVQTTKTTRVDDSGNVSVPMLSGPIKAAGLTAPQLERAIAQAYRDANIIRVAQVSVTLAAASDRQATFDRLMHALQTDDRDEFIKDSTQAVQQGLTAQTLASLSRDLAPDLAKGYDETFLAPLNQQGCQVALWKETFRDGRDDMLAKVSTRNGLLAGFFIQ